MNGCTFQPYLFMYRMNDFYNFSFSFSWIKYCNCNCVIVTDTLSVKLLHIIFERVTRWNILLVKEQKFRREFIEKALTWRKVWNELYRNIWYQQNNNVKPFILFTGLRFDPRRCTWNHCSNSFRSYYSVQPNGYYTPYSAPHKSLNAIKRSERIRA